jgi:hypothetical protein
MNLSWPWRFLRLVAAAGCLAAHGGSLAAQDVSKDKPLELPTYTVTDSRELPPPEPWLYGRIPGFEVLSNASEKSTKRLVGDFQRFFLALSLVWPGVQQKTAVPTSLIICGRGGKFDGFIPTGQQRPNRAPGIAAHLEQRLRKPVPPAGGHARHPRALGMEHRRAAAHQRGCEQHRWIVAGHRKEYQADQRRPHANGQ